VYSGKYVMQEFYRYIQKEEEDICKILDRDVPMLPLTDDEQRGYDAATICYSCNQQFNNDKVRHHCHVTGRFTSACCNRCNLQLRYHKKGQKRTLGADGKPNNAQYFIPVIAHNLHNYDGHIILKHFEGQAIPKNKAARQIQNVSVIPLTRRNSYLSKSADYDF
jgi:hypothetical protein